MLGLPIPGQYIPDILSEIGIDEAQEPYPGDTGNHRRSGRIDQRVAWFCIPNQDSTFDAPGSTSRVSPSIPAEHWREDDHDEHGPCGVDRQVVGLPAFEARE